MKWNSFNDYMPGTKVENMLICYTDLGESNKAYSIVSRDGFDYNQLYLDQKTRKELRPKYWIDLDTVGVVND